MKITIIGDVHGKLSAYKKIIDGLTINDISICVGDFGFEYEWDWFVKNVTRNHYINPGNHDFGPYLNDKTKSLGNYHFFNNLNLFTVRGAESIDKHLRTEGFDWFPNEELSYPEQLEAFDCYCKVKPKIVISHDCPQSVMEKLFGYSEKSQTRTMLENMFQEHQPDLWVFGHHHKSKDVQINGTKFVCLAELEKMEIEL